MAEVFGTIPIQFFVGNNARDAVVPAGQSGVVCGREAGAEVTIWALFKVDNAVAIAAEIAEAWIVGTGVGSQGFTIAILHTTAAGGVFGEAFAVHANRIVRA